MGNSGCYINYIVCVNNKTLKRMVSIFIIKHQMPKGTWVKSTCIKLVCWEEFAHILCNIYFRTLFKISFLCWNEYFSLFSNLNFGRLLFPLFPLFKYCDEFKCAKINFHRQVRWFYFIFWPFPKRIYESRDLYLRTLWPTVNQLLVQWQLSENGRNHTKLNSIVQNLTETFEVERNK